MLNCVNKLRSPILVLDFPRSGESSGGGLAPHHWHFSHPVFVMTGLRVTEVPFVKYRTIGLFCCQRTYRKSSEVEHLKNISLYTSRREWLKDNHDFRNQQKIHRELLSLGRHRKEPKNSYEKKIVKKFFERKERLAFALK